MIPGGIARCATVPGRSGSGIGLGGRGGTRRRSGLGNALAFRFNLVLAAFDRTDARNLAADRIEENGVWLFRRFGQARNFRKFCQRLLHVSRLPIVVNLPGVATDPLQLFLDFQDQLRPGGRRRAGLRSILRRQRCDLLGRELCPLGIERLVRGFKLRCGFGPECGLGLQRGYRLLSSSFRLGFGFRDGSLGFGLCLGNRGLGCGVSLADGLGFCGGRCSVGVGLRLGNRRFGCGVRSRRGRFGVSLRLGFLGDKLGACRAGQSGIKAVAVNP